MTKLFKRIRQKGNLMLGYTFAKSLGLTNAVVLERILTEYQHATKHGLIANSEFGSTFELIGYHIGLNACDIQNSMMKLQELNLINFRVQGDFVLIRVNEDNIVDFEETEEARNKYQPWHYRLYDTQKDAYEINAAPSGVKF